MSNKVLVIGKTGQLARCLEECAHSAPALQLEFSGRDELDLSKPEKIAGYIAQKAPAIVINAAAYTAVDKAEDDEELATLVNAVAPGEIAKGASMVDAPVVHVSTDYVFDGTSRRSYRESDPVNPLGVYGRSKLAGELAVSQANHQYVIIRTAWVYSAYGNNFVKTMLRHGSARDELSVVDDQIGNPTSAHDLATVILQIAKSMANNRKDASFGVYHAAGTGSATWCDFSRFIFECTELAWGSKPTVNAILTEEYPTPAKRPANSRLDSQKLNSDYGLSLPHWTEATRKVVEQILRENS